MPEGLAPSHVAEAIVAGLAAGKRELPATAFVAQGVPAGHVAWGL